MVSTSYSPWFILLCLAVGAAYAALLYSAQAPWGRALNYALAALRLAVVSFLCFLLLAPVIRRTTTRTEAPTVVLAVDNSQSVELFTAKNSLRQATTGLTQLAATLRQRGFTVETRTLGTLTPGIPGTSGSGLDGNNGRRPARPDSLRFAATTTDLGQLLTGTRQAYQDRNLAAVVLVSDGLANRGPVPVPGEYSFPMYSVALGDTVPKQDLRLTNLTYNRVAYL